MDTGIRMNTGISIKRLGMAIGFTGALFYLGCIVLMISVGHQGSVQFFNTLLHGLDVSSILRPAVPLWEAALGIVQTFVLGWLIGACIASLYNLFIKKG
jgi:hypothetical protein